MRKFEVGGMSCAACSARVERAVSSLEGVESCAVNLLTATMTVESNLTDAEIIKAVRAAGYTARLSRQGETSDDDGETKKVLKRFITSLALLIPLMYLSMGHMLGLPLFWLSDKYILLGVLQMVIALAVILVNVKFFINGVKGVINLSPNMDTLVALGSGASFLYSVAIFIVMCVDISGGGSGAEYMHEFYFESAAMILTLITLGKMLESRAKGKTMGALRGLMDLAPKMARIIVDGEEREVSIECVKVGDLFAVRPGESIATDGVIVEGRGSLDESAITGESIPVDKGVGDTVIGATINKSGYFICRATSVGEETVLSGIIKMVSDASATKAPIAKIADKVSAVFVPIVIIIAALTVLIWLLLDKSFGYALARGVSVLVISCPCALGLATPVAIMVGMGVGARRGVLFKTAEALEALDSVKTVLLDKTGTITKGEPTVTDVIPCGVSEEQLLTLAYGVEIGSEHPLARAVVNYCVQKGIEKPEISAFESLTGSGVSATVNGESVIGGSYAYYSSLSEPSDYATREFDKLSGEGKTPLYFLAGGKLVGIIAVADTVKEESSEAISAISSLGVTSVMLTGDNERTAHAVAGSVGIETVAAGVMPGGKEEIVRKYREDGKVLMVGDGINDAPALVSADVGAAIGRGVDIAIDSADVVLMRDTLNDVPFAIALSRATVRNIKENLFWAFIYNIIGIPLAMGAFIPLFGWELNPMFGALAMSFSSFFVVMNALRLNFFKVKKH